MLQLRSTIVNEKPQSVWHSPVATGLQLRLVQNKKELKAVQRLRFKIFSDEMNAVFPDSQSGIDADRFDAWCEHFMVVDQAKDKVVGTYRFLSPENARLANGYYSDSEFDLSPLAGIRDNLVEVGRSCIHSKYRSGGVIMLLWTGIAHLMRQGGYRYLLGCASVSLRDDGVTAAKVWREAQQSIVRAPDMPRLTPLHRYPVDKLNSTLPAKIPPLIKGYLNLGANICGEPAWDPDFNTADFPVLLDLQQLDSRYRRHFGFE
ncbi:GNAT family N-acetyltransferase [Paenalcaligenes niemegkensis]|uniref:GNAT family N-acetyltransferase n=1 Tax=Paenalcaligenes niemegkensis TaxID=2895469 RepID=UPI001EE8EC23|nr:GNAT family N-acyltransferase [Paenalcaligenes niemegkensis]MCQ9615807.1 GNAT family N-acetyltransferase [Paenalcaligenes niemegkensis]